MPDEWTAKINTYLDGELREDEIQELDSHLKNCPGCAADVLARLQLRRAAQTAGHRYTPNPELRRRVQAQIAAPARRSSWLAWGAAVAVLCLVCIAALVAVNRAERRSLRAQTFSELADLHVGALASPNPVDVVSSDRHTVKPWFEGKIPFAFNLPELQNTEFTLLGGRLVYLGQAPAAQLIYRAGKHQISVFVVQEERLGRGLPSDSGLQKRVSFSIETWRQEGLRYFVIGDAEASTIGRLGELFKKAAGS
jgi:anti-sigma factor RsiW